MILYTLFEQMKSIFRKCIIGNTSRCIDTKSSANQSPFIWCLVGNIAGKNLPESVQEMTAGTKHFSPGTKVYCFPPLWGDGYENIRVMGKHRKTGRNICIIMQAKHITDWRLQKVYRPYILNIMRTKEGWTDSDHDKESILSMLKWLPDRILQKPDI